MYLIYSIVPLFYNKNVSECTVFRPKYLTGPTTLDPSRTPSSIPSSISVFVQASLYYTVLSPPPPVVLPIIVRINRMHSESSAAAIAEILIDTRECCYFSTLRSRNPNNTADFR